MPHISEGVMAMPQQIDYNAFISALDYSTLRQVAAPMDEDGSWKDRFLTHCSIKGHFTLSDTEIQKLERISQNPHSQETPALALLRKLGNRGMTVRLLLEYLRELNMHRSQMPFRNPEQLVITHHPVAMMELREGDTLQLACQAAGFPSPKYRWIKDREVIPGAFTEILTIANVRACHSGKYLCQVYNEREYTKSHCSLVKVYPGVVQPQQHLTHARPAHHMVPHSHQMLCITSQPESQVAPPGGIVTFHCEATSNVPLMYRWFRRATRNCHVEALLHNPAAGVLVKHGTLQCQRVSLSDMGFYWCTVTDQAGNTVDTEQVELIVQRKLQVVEEPVAEQSVPIRGRACFEVRLQQMGPVIYQWYHNGQLVQPDGDVVRQEMTSVTSCELSVRIRSHADGGSYQCRVTSPTTGEEILSAVSQLTVLETPKQYTATLKVALLIGISTYVSEHKLPAVKADLQLLKSKLENIGFCVTTLIDLEYEEICHAVKGFTNLLCQGVYGVLFLQGHGFESEDHRVYLRPTDACVLSAKNCVDTNEIFGCIRRGRGALSALFVDVCRTPLPGAKPRPAKPHIHGDRNTVVIYSTGSGLEALERVNAKNGIFVDLLCRAIDSGKQDIRQLFITIQDLLKQDPTAAKLQIPEINFTLDEARSLHDLQDFTGVTQEVNKRLLRWQNMHDLPSPIPHECFNIHFAIELSNILRMFITARDPRMKLLAPEISNFPDEIAKPKVVSALPLQVMIDFTELQKLRNNLDVDLNIRFSKDGRFEEQTLHLELGRPMFAISALCKHRETAQGQHESLC